MQLKHILNIHLRKARILFDEEAEADFCKPGGRDSGAWFLELVTGKVEAY